MMFRKQKMSPYLDGRVEELSCSARVYIQRAPSSATVAKRLGIERLLQLSDEQIESLTDPKAAYATTLIEDVSFDVIRTLSSSKLSLLVTMCHGTKIANILEEKQAGLLVDLRYTSLSALVERPFGLSVARYLEPQDLLMIDGRIIRLCMFEQAKQLIQEVSFALWRKIPLMQFCRSLARGGGVAEIKDKLNFRDCTITGDARDTRSEDIRPI